MLRKKKKLVQADQLNSIEKYIPPFFIRKRIYNQYFFSPLVNDLVGSQNTNGLYPIHFHY